jgi:ATP-dependent Lhr-like helicase
LAALTALRISRIKNITVSFAMDDYGFELFCDQPMPIEEALARGLFTTDRLHSDLLEGANVSDMARRQFRDIARIAGLVFQGFPNKMLKARHLQANSQLFFDVFREYEPDNLLFKQAYDQVLRLQLDETRLYTALTRLSASTVKLVTLTKPSPFGFGLMVDHLREKMTTEKLTDRVKRLQLMAA